jgi:hypothetical protein
VQTENCVPIGIVTETFFEKKCFGDRECGQTTVKRVPEDPRWRSVGATSCPDLCSRYKANYTDPMGTDARDVADSLSGYIEVARDYYMPDADDDGGALSVTQDFLSNTIADISQGTVDMLRVGSSTGEVIGRGDGDWYDYGMALSEDTGRASALVLTFSAPASRLTSVKASPTLQTSKPVTPAPRSFKTPYKPLSPKAKTALKSKLQNRTITLKEYKHLKWDSRFKARRAKGVSEFWTMEQRLLQSGKPGTRNWTPEQRAAILRGERPTFNNKPIEGHHTYNVLDYPQAANNPNYIYPVTRSEHFGRWHGRNFRNRTHGRPLNPLFPEEF